MKKIFVFCFLLLAVGSKAQLLSWTPDFIKETDAGVEITCDATKGNQVLLNYNPSDVFVHIGVITNYSTGASDWKHVPFTWGTTNPAAQAVSLGGNKWKFTFASDLRTFFGVTDPAEHIRNIAILFRSGSGNNKLSNTDGSDMYVPLYETGLQSRLTQPFRQPKFIPVLEPISKNVGDAIAIEARSNIAANLKLYFNGAQINALNGTSITANPVVTVPGNQRIISEAELGGVYKRDTVDFFVASSIVIENLPVGIVEGINYEAGGQAVTLVLFAPEKGRCSVIGDFNSWTEQAAYQMKKTPDGKRFWLRITGLTPGTEYAYQYLFDGTAKFADYNAEKVLDPNNDQYIPASTYPNLKAYPTGLTTGIVSVLQTNKPAYTWSNAPYTRPDKRSLVVYELLVRDFVAKQDWKTLTDTLSYLKRLGINAIELMPINEFEGNNSWGYNPSFYFAPDKIYGPENDLRRFIDSCHSNGMAVIMDIALNHSFGQSPMVQMYWDAANSRPAANSPWFNPVAKHAYNVGYDINHESQATKDFVDRVTDHWLNKYKIDGFRWDLAKGFTQVQTCDNNGGNCNEGTFAAYDASRVAIWKRIYDKMQVQNPGSYCILELFAQNAEELEYSNYGMMMWGNSNYNYNEATMGYISTSNFQGVIHTQRGWTQPNLIGYAESHDEERLMYKNEMFGNSTQAPTYNVKSIPTGLARQGMAAAFLIPIPGPKMIWQFGELGYDYSINRCEDGSINNNCRTNPKPIVWNFYQDPTRKNLYDIYAKLNKLKTAPTYASTFTGNDITWDLANGFKWIKINGTNLKVMIIGNFDVVPQTASVTFQNAGTWYSYLTGTLRTATGAPESITLQPGEYYVYTSVDASAVLPLNLVSFTGKRNTNSIDLTWSTTNEIGVRSFEVERSADAMVYSTIGTVSATNNNGNQSIVYRLQDQEAIALQATKPIYYRLKMIDKDGKINYSNLVSIAPINKKQLVGIYPNPVTDNMLYVQITDASISKIHITILDASGRVHKQYATGAGATNNVIPIQLDALAAGLYLLKAESNNGTTIERFIKK